MASSMKAYLLSLLALVVFAGAGIWLVASRPSAATTAVPPPLAKQDAPSAPAPRVITGAGAVETPRDLRPAPQPVATQAAPQATGRVFTLQPGGEEATHRVKMLAATSDPEHVPELVAHLQHPIASVRRQALLGLVMIGDAGAAPLLRAAAEKADPVEAHMFRDAAAQLERLTAADARMPRTALADWENMAATPVTREQPSNPFQNQE